MPCVLTGNIPDEVMLLESNQDHANVRTDGKCNTLPAAMGMGGGYVPMVAYCIQGNTIDRKLENGANGKGVLENKSFTLNTVDRHAVATFASKSFSEWEESDKGSTLKASGGTNGGQRIPCSGENRGGYSGV